MVEPTRTIFLRWERLRILYNANLLITVIATLYYRGRLSDLGTSRFLLYVGLGSLAANVCFTMGPVAESWAAWSRIPHREIGLLLFTVGLLVSVAIALLFVLLYAPYMD